MKFHQKSYVIGINDQLIDLLVFPIAIADMDAAIFDRKLAIEIMQNVIGDTNFSIPP
ncbi:hypothetical protein [Ancylomarina longa]|uniref:hypothetical protein n=1 Tax=Ancylomarina longa TaxID=2487017 RepID=UPI001ADE4806|nr:hypothetical protein [Ancylomarina longa]